MRNFLEKLRQKDDAQKTVIAIVGALVITFVIVTTWLTWNFAQEEKEEKVAKKKTDVTPISSLSSQVAEIGNIVGEFKEQLEISKEMMQELKNSATTSESVEIESSVQ